MTVKLIIFDCDGVLVDTETLSNQLLVENLARYGLEISLDDAMGMFVGGSMQGVKQRAEELGAQLPENWVDEIYALTYDKLREGVEPIDGILGLVEVLQSINLPFCVASNGSEEKMGITLGSTGLSSHFANAMFSAHKLNTWKPEPDLFLAAAAHFGVPAADCAVIEDSHNGVVAAMSAGMRCYAYTPEKPNQAFIDLGATCFDRMQDIPELLQLSTGR